MPRYLRKRIADFSYKMTMGNVFGYERLLAEAGQWDLEKRQGWRLDKLNQILDHCWDRTTFYPEYWQDHGVRRKKLRLLAELAEFPVLPKDVFRDNMNRCEADNLDRISCHWKATGGSTGQPLRYRQDKKTWAFTQAFHYWGWGQMGYEFGDAIAIIAGGSLLPGHLSIKAKIRRWIENRIYFPGVHMDDDLARSHAQKMMQKKPRFIYGYPSIIAMLGESIRKQGLEVTDIQGVVTTSEMLRPAFRTSIENNFQTEVFDHAGCNDGGYMAYECGLHNGLHYNDLLSILETTSDSGQEDRLLITNLWNRSMPFVRYENGDTLKLGKEPCSCGQAFPLIESIEGRAMDVLEFSNGRSLSGPALTIIFREMHIASWQIVQKTPDSVEVRIQCDEIKKEWENHIRKMLKCHVGEDVRVSVVPIDKLERFANGKLKPVWSEVDRAK
ncbi:MAG: phenylacetate--CoA ligase family protein [Candidatus Sumerlaeia bacterium]